MTPVNGPIAVTHEITSVSIGVGFRKESPPFLYVDEFAFRLNDGNVVRHTLDRLDSFIDGVAGKRLTYKTLIA